MEIKVKDNAPEAWPTEGAGPGVGTEAGPVDGRRVGRLRAGTRRCRCWAGRRKPTAGVGRSRGLEHQRVWRKKWKVFHVVHRGCWFDVWFHTHRETRWMVGRRRRRVAASRTPAEAGRRRDAVSCRRRRRCGPSAP